MQRAQTPAFGSRTGNVAAHSRIDGALATAIGRFHERVYNTILLYYINIFKIHIVLREISVSICVINYCHNVQLRILLNCVN